MKIEDCIQSDNIAADLDHEDLLKIGEQVVSGYEADLDSRKPWKKDLKLGLILLCRLLK